MRLQSTIPGLISFPIFVLGFAWITEEHVHISGMCVMLFMTGLTQLCVFRHDGALSMLMPGQIRLRKHAQLRRRRQRRPLFVCCSAQQRLPRYLCIRGH